METSKSQTPATPVVKKAPRFNNRTDPVKNFERWKKKYSKKQQKCKTLRKERRKPEWQVERESISRLVQRYNEITLETIIKFSDFPLSRKTLRGLQEAQYRMPSEIQKQTIGLALQGKDVLGAAKTGSGKTLAFLIPALECLYRQQWTADDGLGVLIISPTRELAYQTFEVLRKVGKNHEFSAGLIIGGKFEKLLKLHVSNVELYQTVSEQDGAHAAHSALRLSGSTLLYISVHDIASPEEQDECPEGEGNRPSTPVRSAVTYVGSGAGPVLALKNVKDLKQESASIHRTNILICTPGRLLQHMDETSFFHASNLQMLILDEADRILDMGFAATMNAIIENLPKKRQTLLFSATQTKSVKDLARLSLKDPEYVWVHDKAKFSTPATLEQNYVVCELPQKINMLYSFIRNHLKKKSIVFFASCKEVQYLFRVFCRLRPGIPILALHGKQQQMKRMEVYNDFIRKKSAVLFATDIAARGLDFPAVNWVLQLDCPEDASTYIHRVGRTARYKEGGEALLVLLPSEEKGMVQQLTERKVPINGIKINPEKLVDVQTRLEAFLAQEQELKERAQRCFVSYLRSVYLMKNKEVFDVFKLPLVQYALSLGLAIAPRVRFLQKAQAQRSAADQAEKGKTMEMTSLSKEIPSVSDDEVEEFRACLKAADKTKGGQSKSAVASPSSDEESEELEDDSEEESFEPSTDDTTHDKLVSLRLLDDDDEDDARDLDLLTVKRRDVFGLDTPDCSLQCEDEESPLEPKKSEKVSKIKGAKKVLKKKFKVNTKIKFTDDGKLIQQWPPVQKSAVKDPEECEDTSGINLDKAKERLHEEDKFDKEEYRRKIKEKHREKRLKAKAARRARSNKPEEDKEAVAYLDREESEDEIDLSTLPDPDKFRDPDQEDLGNEMDENESNELLKKTAKRKRTLGSSGSRAEGEETPSKIRTKKAKRGLEESKAAALDTGLSLAEDEKLVLHLLASRS